MADPLIDAAQQKLLQLRSAFIGRFQGWLSYDLCGVVLGYHGEQLRAFVLGDYVDTLMAVDILHKLKDVPLHVDRFLVPFSREELIAILEYRAPQPYTTVH